jgi:hypothetical protein
VFFDDFRRVVGFLRRASKMAKSGFTAKQINEDIALDHRQEPNRPQMHPAERAELAKNYGIQIDRL